MVADFKFRNDVTRLSRDVNKRFTRADGRFGPHTHTRARAHVIACGFIRLDGRQIACARSTLARFVG